MVKVELTADHLDDSINDAVRWFAAKKGVKKGVFIPLALEQMVYALDDDIDTVTDVVFPSPGFDIALAFFPFNLFDGMIPYDVFSASASGGGLYSSFVQALQHIEQAKRITGSEQDWRQEGRKLHLYPKSNVGNAYIEYKSTHVVIEQLNERDHDLVKRWALAETKEILGRIRSKYDTYPGAQGSVTLDGKDLLEEAKATKEALDEEIALSGYPMGFLVG